MKLDALAGGLPGLSVRRPHLAAVMNILIIIAGISALLGVEVRELPDIDRPIVSVRANYPGASPTTVDAEVTAKVERAVARVNGVVALQSSSEEGNFRMRVEFQPGQDLSNAANDLREAVSRISAGLPDGVEDLRVVKSDRDASPVVQIAIWSDGAAIDALTRRVEDEVIPEFIAVDGVSEVTVFGARERVLRVEVRPDRLAAFGLSIGEVSEVLRAAQFDVPVGSFEADALEVLVRADATVSEPKAIEALIVRDPIRLGDLADVYFSPASAESVARLNDRLVLNLGIVREAKSNTVEISGAVEGAIDRLRARFPQLRFQVINDDAVFISGAVREVLTSLAIALLIVVGVIWLFIGNFSATLIPAVTIPVALTGSVAAIWLFGFSINLITLLALVLATGLVVDDAIVVLENIQRRRLDGMGAKAAAVIGTRQVFFAVVATTVTLIAVFIPISFLPSSAGRLFREFGFVLAVTVAISSFVALTLCPLMAARLGGLGNKAPNPLGRALAALYALLLKPVLAMPLVSLTVAGLLAATALIVYQDLGEELIPPEDRGAVTVWLQGPDGTGLDYTDRQVAAVERMMAPWVEAGVAEGLYSISGRYDLNRGRIGMRLVNWDKRDTSQDEIEADIRPKLSELAGARARVWRTNSLGLSANNSGLEIALTGPNYQRIAEVTDRFVEKMEQIEGLSDIRVQYQATQPQLSIAIDRRRAADLKVAMTELSSTLRALIDEDEIGELTVEDETVPIVLQSAAGAMRDPSSLLNLYVRAETGDLVPLTQLITFSEKGVAAELDRHAQRRAIEIDATIDPSLALSGAVEAVRRLALETLPDDVSLLLLGEAEALEETSSEIAVTFVIAIAVVFLVLVAQFESITSALVVMLTLPFSVCAAVYALWLTGTTINIYSQIGVLMLIGIVAKNGILLVEFADQLRDRGLGVKEAAAEAARQRLRPIVMTLASTVLAGLPLILGSGPGSEARAAIGWVVFGGLGLAALSTLFLGPAAYALIAGISRPRAAGWLELEREISAVSQGEPGKSN